MWYGSENITNLAIDFTTRCNLRCDYCYLFTKQDADRRELSVDELLSVVDKTLLLFPRIKMMELWGGEPTFDAARLREFVQGVRARGIDTWVPSTNGTLIGDRETYEAWRNCNQTFNSQVSFDGNKKYHDKFRCNTYDKVVANMRKALFMGCKISIRTTYPFTNFIDGVKENMIEFPKLYKEFSSDPNINPSLVEHLFAIMEYNGRKLMMIYQEVDTIFKHDEIMFRAAQYRDAYDVFAELLEMRKHDDVIFLPPYINDTVNELLSPKKFIEPKNCGSFISQVYLHTPTGDVYPCLSQDVNVYKSIARLVNVYTQEINWPAVNTIRSFMLRRNRNCMTCFMQASCFGGCYHCSPETENSFNQYWNTANITKCIFAHHIFDKVIEISKRLVDHLNKP
jgi:radical SAM protein with 4Fe4S-binding SPASM domain